ncbi:hypothetical protein GCM10010124_14580 [Pilimelia terevasa]|uniref:Uncharacterized protein n=1 Tax=Pilimelia terevasa TaxID=53372 RepID=A0A8J3BI44_9ACTN|nr:hypothetical protein [Pilimelia terevasa]GGK23141.1 hypothetical protein GCM10010124_14580 [Pilimelia terevasa]
MAVDPWTPGPRRTEIRVDPAGLRAFAREVRTENEATLRPHARTVLADFGQGVPFGAHARSRAVAAAQDRYRHAMVRAIDTLHAYVADADTLATAAERIAAAYGATDAAAAAHAADVAATLAAALAQVPAGPGPTR